MMKVSLVVVLVALIGAVVDAGSQLELVRRDNTNPIYTNGPYCIHATGGGYWYSGYTATAVPCSPTTSTYFVLSTEGYVLFDTENNMILTQNVCNRLDDCDSQPFLLSEDINGIGGYIGTEVILVQEPGNANNWYLQIDGVIKKVCAANKYPIVLSLYPKDDDCPTGYVQAAVAWRTDAGLREF
ncbi:uncharacterized protein LOC119072826 [Bradysia coprophila]|uniref:uncharacterized protein LOC119072826 n=1 Tax=Bradysia coprophila TaxID=38358 RepID=UPI00187DB40C|nr:uncharacterized protein LOC119072826 [Bradysia coprophila]